MKISMIIPIYNSEMYIRKCIDSILAQTVKPHEVILVDDGSDDLSLKICREYERNYSYIKVIYQQNKGQNAARSTGVNNATGDYVLFVDSDDWIDDNYVQAFCDIFSYIGNDVDLICTGYKLEYLQTSIICSDITECSVYEEEDIYKNICEGFVYDLKKRGPSLTHSLCAKLIKRTHLIEILNSKSINDITLDEDGLVLFDLLCRCKKVCVHPYHGYHYIQRESSRMHSLSQSDFEIIERLRNEYIFLSKKCGLYDKMSQSIDRFMGELGQSIVACTLGYEYDTSFVLPSNVFNSQLRIAVYGAGVKGREFRKIVNEYENLEVVAWVDQNFKNFDEELNVQSPQKLQEVEFDMILIAIENRSISRKVEKHLLDIGIDFDKIWPLEVERIYKKKKDVYFD